MGLLSRPTNTRKMVASLVPVAQMIVDILHAKSGKTLTSLSLSQDATVIDVKKAYKKIRGKSLKDDQKLKDIGLSKDGQLYFKDLGPQVGWTTVFLTEYAGPLVIYLCFYARPAIIYGVVDEPKAEVVNIACGCWTFHYAKRLLETMFVHRFSHTTMPILNIFKNSIYYWGFAAFVAYFINHPLYTPPAFGDAQVYGGLAGFVLCELGNFSVHIALRNLRPPGTKERRIPFPTSNPLTGLFSLVSCPNYTYEFGSWLSFSIMTQSLPALVFTIAGFYQMAVWARGKHRNYVKEFKNYPRRRMPILPFLL
ncbi:hypothetical protein LSH36_145g04076 [Paralvinella palmiformis]|uniref:very-long-chain enoyl-CoA reductase n=1 Tax=Paralvinella palmiformis TaxID=53620 RepID=A0AAD9JUZ2_9ANNE|nr:hypothetical protein LSH36_145g04076 [Paralvinella palmiformis]